MNSISKAHGREDQQAATIYVSSAYFMFVTISLAILITFILIYPYVSWEKVFNVKSALAIREAGPALAVFFLCFTANLSLGIVQSVQMGYQEGYLNNLWEILGQSSRIGRIAPGDLLQSWFGVVDCCSNWDSSPGFLP